MPDSIKRVEAAEVVIRMTVGWLEPHCIDWYEGLKAAKILIVVWLLVGISFNLFYNVEFRSSLMTQNFPPDIDHLDQIEIFRDGLFYDYHSGGTVK